jgi:hypothetical protein
VTIYKSVHDIANCPETISIKIILKINKKQLTSPFWPLIFEDGLEYKPYVTDVLEFTETERILEAGMNVNSIFARGDFKGKLLAIRLDASIS